MKIVNKLKNIRTQMGLSQRELAKKAGLSPSLIAQIELGQKHPSWLTADRIAAALGVPVEIVFPRFAKRLSPKLEDTTKAKV